MSDKKKKKTIGKSLSLSSNESLVKTDVKTKTDVETGREYILFVVDGEVKKIWCDDIQAFEVPCVKACGNTIKFDGAKCEALLQINEAPNKFTCDACIEKEGVRNSN